MTVDQCGVIIADCCWRLISHLTGGYLILDCPVCEEKYRKLSMSPPEVTLIFYVGHVLSANISMLTNVNKCPGLCIVGFVSVNLS